MDYDLISYLEYNLYRFSTLEHSIATHFIEKKDLNKLKIKDVADEAYVSTSSISRFVKKIGFDNYKQFIYNFEKSFETRTVEKNDAFLQHMSLWNNHKLFYKSIYKHIATLNIGSLRNRIMQSNLVSVFGYGEMKNIKDVFQSTIGIFQNNVISCDHIEQFNQIIKNKLAKDDLIIIFMNYSHYETSLNKIIDAAKEKSVPIAIISTSLKITNSSYPILYNLYPNADTVYNRFSSTLYFPYLIFVDYLMQSLEKESGVLNPKYDSYSE